MTIATANNNNNNHSCLIIQLIFFCLMYASTMKLITLAVFLKPFCSLTIIFLTIHASYIYKVDYQLQSNVLFSLQVGCYL